MKYLKYFEELIHKSYTDEISHPVMADMVTTPQPPIKVSANPLHTTHSIDTRQTSHLVEPNRIYEVDWKEFAPKSLVLIKGDITDMNGYLLDQKTGKPTNQLCKYKQANIMADLMMQVTYERDFDVLGIPDTLQFDMTIINPDELNFEMSIEITFGDLVAAGFEIKRPNEIRVHQYTSFGSKADPSDTVFGFTETSLNKLIRFFNHFDGLRVTRSDLNFLDNNKHNYKPHS